MSLHHYSKIGRTSQALTQGLRNKLSLFEARRFKPNGRYRKRYRKRKRKGGELCVIRSMQQPDRLRVRLQVVDDPDDITAAVASVDRLCAGNSAFVLRLLLVNH